MARQYLKVFFDWKEATSELTSEEKGRLIDALVSYAQGEPVDLTGNERFVFPAFKLQIDRDAIAYEEISEKRKAAGAKGGKQTQAKSSKNKQMLHESSKTQAKSSKSSHDHDHDHDHDQEKEKDYIMQAEPAPKRLRFSPPTLEEITLYIREMGYAVDPQRFLDHYESVGWMVGKSPMKDWKAAVRTWNNREKPQQTQPQIDPRLLNEPGDVFSLYD